MEKTNNFKHLLSFFDIMCYKKDIMRFSRLANLMDLSHSKQHFWTLLLFEHILWVFRWGQYEAANNFNHVLFYSKLALRHKWSVPLQCYVSTHSYNTRSHSFSLCHKTSFLPFFTVKAILEKVIVTAAAIVWIVMLDPMQVCMINKEQF